jgi:DNA-binding LytR/AlgR family response regulator
MGNLIKILVVEDEMIIGAKISMQLTNLGYEVTGILPRGEDAILHLQENKPDIVLLDINLKGKLDGIDTAIQLQQIYNIPIIYLTANADDSTFNRAKITKPAAFISKPFKQLDLQRAIELTISRMAEIDGNSIDKDKPLDSDQPFVLSDRIFVRHNDMMVKIMLDSILYIEAERNYSRIFTKEKEYLLSITLKTIEEKLPLQIFQRIHRSFIVNITHVEKVAEDHITIVNKSIPISDGLKGNLLQRIQKL